MSTRSRDENVIDESMMLKVTSPSEGILIIEDVKDRYGVETIKGIFDPLMQGAGA